ncbi:MAG: 2'-deoxycytidine 5'-triphosphate deaminase [Acidimicrobiales bacterium]|nr:MAG: 2'-deoxycytidine 5'-triphosphate deaminase [Acidimicrobiales bacterium]
MTILRSLDDTVSFAPVPEVLDVAELTDRGPGVLPSQMLRRAAASKWIISDDPPEEASIQPASIDLHLGAVAYRIRCSFLAPDETVADRLGEFVLDELDLTGRGAVLEVGRPYLIPLREGLALPAGVRGRTNPKSSTGRLDVFCRVVTDFSFRFDEVAEGYSGPLYLEVVPLSFTVRVRQGLSLNQLRLVVGDPSLSRAELLELHASDPLVWCGGEPVDADRAFNGDGLLLSLDLAGSAEDRVGWRARPHAPLLDLSSSKPRLPDPWWEPVRPEAGGRVVLAPGTFYLLLSREEVRIPPGFAAEMAAYDPTSGELRAHYAGFFDPGFGHAEVHRGGSRAALEVRAHDVPFVVEDGQPVCKLTFEKMLDVPDKLYGAEIGSHYQGQTETLGKYFTR